ncbi:MAG: hypothetical protein F6K26_02080 [Moorea sp. SIO2I5]|nr:hypothetical protein [Moorena sp. SIO2I5]
MNIDSSFLPNFATSLIYDPGVLGSREWEIGSRESGDREMAIWGKFLLRVIIPK